MKYIESRAKIIAYSNVLIELGIGIHFKNLHEVNRNNQWLEYEIDGKFERVKAWDLAFKFYEIIIDKIAELKKS